MNMYLCMSAGNLAKHRCFHHKENNIPTAINTSCKAHFFPETNALGAI